VCDSVVPGGLSAKSEASDQSAEAAAVTHDVTRELIPCDARAVACELTPDPWV
jgi:hypothetical protein